MLQCIFGTQSSAIQKAKPSTAEGGQGAPPVTLLLILAYHEAALTPVAHSEEDDRPVSLKVYIGNQDIGIDIHNQYQ